MPPTLVEEQTVLQKVTKNDRHYGEALSARFGQLYRNITGSPHKPFNPQTFSNALTHFSMLAVLVFGFYWLIRLCALPLYRKMGQWARQKNRERSNWLQLPAMIIGAFIIDLLAVTGPDIICRPGIKRQPECRQSHHRFPTKFVSQRLCPH